MARGWESKSVEDQINDRQAQAETAAKKKSRPHEIEQKSKRDGILLARAHTVSALESTRDERYRVLLKRTLDHLDAELAKLV